MPFFRFIQDAFAGSTSKHPSYSETDCERTKLTQTLEEKNQIIERNNEKIYELEDEAAELQRESMKARRELDSLKAARNEKLKQQTNKLVEYDKMVAALVNYDALIEKTFIKYNERKRETAAANSRLGDMEAQFTNFSQKYERLTDIINGYQLYQDQLLRDIDLYKNSVLMCGKKYKNYKQSVTDMMDKIDHHFEEVKKKRISERAEMQFKVLKSKFKISQLEKTISNIKSNSQLDSEESEITRDSIFTPLKSNFLL